ncbi:unnamed protein product [Toxocara canis]|uniref:7TM GPCR serpentine receptor class x (Srx) domain-containing protein n=1 Tax=Toxocara canis TaxID=6265 RepID=A0A3P7IN36_TOXCA|nr:unnamed protein product [Toxocara canis]
MTIVFYYAGIYTNILITMNRCFIITWPALYQKYFNTSMTLRWIVLIWTIAFIQSCIYQFRETTDQIDIPVHTDLYEQYSIAILRLLNFLAGCHFYFDSQSYTWTYSASECGYAISTFFECSLNSFAVIFIISMDSFIFYRLRCMHKALLISGSNAISVTEQQQRRKREIRFFLQACCSESLYLFAVANFYGFVQLSRSKWATFILTTMVWELFHTVDGIILVAFNRDVRFCCHKKAAKKSEKTIEKTAMPICSRRPKPTKRASPLTMVSGGGLVRNVVGPVSNQLRLDAIVESHNKKCDQAGILISTS